MTNLLEKMLSNLLEVKSNYEELTLYMQKASIRESEIERLLNDFRHIRENLKKFKELSKSSSQIKRRLLELDMRENELLNERRILKQESMCYHKINQELSGLENKIDKIQNTFNLVIYGESQYNVRTAEGNDWFNLFIQSGAEFDCKLTVPKSKNSKSTSDRQPLKESRKKSSLRITRDKKAKKWELRDFDSNEIIKSDMKLALLLSKASKLGRIVDYPNEIRVEVQKVI